MTPEDIKTLIKQTVQNLYSVKMVGDTPTDANQLVPKKYVDAHQGTTIYTGSINADGTALSLPTGWTSVVGGTSAYTVTHNLNTTDYIVICCVANGLRFCGNTDKLANTFSITTWDKTGALATGPTNFVVIIL